MSPRTLDSLMQFGSNGEGAEPSAGGQFGEYFVRSSSGLCQESQAECRAGHANGEEDVLEQSLPSLCKRALAGRFPHIKIPLPNVSNLTR